MDVISIACIVVGILIIIAILIKVRINRKLKDIEGIIGLFNSDENVVGVEGADLKKGERNFKRKS